MPARPLGPSRTPVQNSRRLPRCVRKTGGFDMEPVQTPAATCRDREDTGGDEYFRRTKDSRYHELGVAARSRRANTMGPPRSGRAPAQISRWFGLDGRHVSLHSFLFLTTEVCADSLTQGHDHAFGSYLQEAGIAFDTNPNHLPLDKSIRTHILRPGHPLTLELQKRAGVPNSRLDYPIFSIIEEHLLVHEPDLRFLTGLYGAKEGWGWFLDSMKRADDWEAFFRWVTAGRPDEEDTVTGDTILLMNTGAHVCAVFLCPFYFSVSFVSAVVQGNVAYAPQTRVCHS